MKFGGFNIGKSKQKANPQDAGNEETAEELIKHIGEDDIPVRPHAPLQELSLETEVTLEGPDEISAEETEEIATEDAEAVKLVEVQVEPSAMTPEEQQAAKNADLNASLSNIFRDAEDEENPLKNLIKTLPDVAANELIDDLKEINEIIKDWQKK